MAAIESTATDAARLHVRVAARLSDSFSLEAAFEAPPGFTMLLGPSGGGKTTLLDCIAGLRQPDSGRVALGSRVVFDSSLKVNLPMQVRRIGYLFQNLALFPHLTVGQNVEYGIAGQSATERHAQATEILETFRIPHLATRKPAEISGGERQRTALARSLVTNPDLLLLDEPLAALDKSIKSRIVDDLRAWNAARGIPILYVTHSPEEAFALGERVIVLEDGKILGQGMPQDVLAAPRHETIAQVVGFENVFDATVKSLAESHGTMLCQLERTATELEVPLGHRAAGDEVRIAIRAGDIMVATESPHGLSARNTFPGRVTAIRREGVTVILSVEAGVTFEVHVTPGAREQLHLAVGQQLWLVVKTYSCHLVRPTA